MERRNFSPGVKHPRGAAGEGAPQDRSFPYSGAIDVRPQSSQRR